MVLEKFTKDSIISLSNLTVIKEIDEYTIGDEQKTFFVFLKKLSM